MGLEIGFGEELGPLPVSDESAFARSCLTTIHVPVSVEVLCKNSV
jgi:hypothetical protein